ncbi:MAG TPA: hypothetical protein VN626_11630 [Clostridia bacterium]|nr:hypothetical protein [Clostridia bacterium]
MIISQVTNGGYYVKSTADSSAVKTTDSSAAVEQQTTAGQSNEDSFVRNQTSEKTDTTDCRSFKKLSASQIKALKDQRDESMQRLVTEMLSKQAEKAETAVSTALERFSDTAGNGLSDWMSQLLDPQDTCEAAAQAISMDGEWGVNAVATRLLDMAVSLSGGDVSKISELRSAVEAGFKAAGAVFGGDLPSVCQDTYTETMNRFDYWAENGGLDGYVMAD